MTNLLIITADDMSYGSTGFAGCEFPQITPTIDKLARSGIFFKNAHTSIGSCQAARSVLMTGLYPWNNGARGFDPIHGHVPTLVEILKLHGYKTGIVGKVGHLRPDHKFPWDMRAHGFTDTATGQIENGKDPEYYYKHAQEFLSGTEPFFLLANSHFPHRDYPEHSRYDHNRIIVPGFLCDTEAVRLEMSRYYEGCSRCDLTVNKVLTALKESGKYDDTLIIFTSDHGMAFPFVKANCYHFSTKIPLIYSMPARFSPQVVEDHVAGIDFMPTILSILNLPCPRTDGRSYLETINTGSPFSDHVYTSLFKNCWHHPYETRAIHNREYCYIINFWHDGVREFEEDGSHDYQSSCASLKQTNPERYQKLKIRCPEELYDIQTDPFATKNIISSPEGSKALVKIRDQMRKIATAHGDESVVKWLSLGPKLL